MEAGCPVTWLTREEFLKWTPFAEFYTDVFAQHPDSFKWATAWAKKEEGE